MANRSRKKRICERIGKGMMKMKDKSKTMIIFAVVVGAVLIFTHSRELNQIPGVEATGGEVTVEIGDFYYNSEG